MNDPQETLLACLITKKLNFFISGILYLIITYSLAHWVKNFSRQHFKIFFSFLPENQFWHFMQIVSWGDSLHEILKSVFREKIRKISWILSSAELAQWVIKIKVNLKQFLFKSSRRQIDIFLFSFSKKIGLIFGAYYLFRRQFAWNFKSYCLRDKKRTQKKERKNTRLSSAETFTQHAQR